MTISSLKDLLLDQLNDIYDAEQQLVIALPTMAGAASGENLKQGFLDHLEETKAHVERLEKAFTKLGVPPKPKTCLAMKGLIAEGAEAIDLKGAGAIRDVALIGAARRVEHYEIAAYKATRGIATGVREEAVADLLQQIMDEECEADKKLCTLSDMAIEAGRDFSGAKAAPSASGSHDKPAKSSVRKAAKGKQK
jgi:ferritin-like metal-binding protein YciE